MVSLRDRIAKNYINAIGWKTKQKYLLIESDDWGAVRMPSIEVYNKLKSQHIEVDKFSFDKLDSIESEMDLQMLFDVLNGFKDIKGNPAVLTAYHVLSNPNFEEIERNGRKEYVYETILDTYKKNSSTVNSFKLIEKGFSEKLYFPQFHGREHIHVKRWMEAINSSSKKEQLTFENRAIIWSGASNCNNPYTKDYFKGFDYDSENEFSSIESIQKDGLDLFRKIFGFNSVTLTAQGSIWGDHILPMLNDNGVKLIGGHQLIPNLGSPYKIKNRFWGDNNKFGQVYWRRNCLFEPYKEKNDDAVNKCLEDIEVAFRWGKPAVISSHRVNFIGSIFPENRENSLKQLNMLLKKVLEKWPDVQFIQSAQLAELMLNSNK
jgi:hypothetical protein